VATLEQGDAQRAGELARKHVARFSRQMERRERQKVTGTLLFAFNEIMNRLVMIHSMLA